MRQIAKKALCALFIVFSSISAIYAANSKNITLNIQGTGSGELVESFKYALKIEANAAGYDVTDNLADAKYYIKFTVEFDQVQQKSKFNVSLVRVADSNEIVAMEYLFTDEEEMLLYSQLVFFMLMANLPEDEVRMAVEDDSWRNKWLYARASIDYSVMLLSLKGKTYLTNDNPANRLISPPLEDKGVPAPGIGLGAEVQFLDFMSAELGVQMSYENLNTMFNMLFSLEIKSPLKFFSGFVPEPYIEVAYPLRFPKGNEIFDNSPKFAFGGGIQVAVKMEKDSALFFEAGYLYYFSGVGMENQYKKDAKGQDFYTQIITADSPQDTIKYNYSVVSFKIGYKYGFFDRKR